MSEQNWRLEDIQAQGWTQALLMTPEHDKAEYARLANEVIDIGLSDEGIFAALKYRLNPGHEPSDRAGTFGIAGARYSEDKKVSLHAGFYSRKFADTVVSERLQPKALRQFWQVHEAMLGDVEAGLMSVLRNIGAEALQASVLPPNPARRNVHMRTVRYIDAFAEPPNTEVFNGHADLGLMSMHIYETHGGWCVGAPYDPALVTADDSPERRQAVTAMRAQMHLIGVEEDYAPFFLGANWQTFPEVPLNLRGLPALYHAGIRPDSGAQEESPFAPVVTGNTEDRVAVIAFFHPNGDQLKRGEYVPAPKSYCRPNYN